MISILYDKIIVVLNAFEVSSVNPLHLDQSINFAIW